MEVFDEITVNNLLWYLAPDSNMPRARIHNSCDISVSQLVLAMKKDPPHQGGGGVGADFLNPYN